MKRRGGEKKWQVLRTREELPVWVSIHLFGHPSLSLSPPPPVFRSTGGCCVSFAHRNPLRFAFSPCFQGWGNTARSSEGTAGQLSSFLLHSFAPENPARARKGGLFPSVLWLICMKFSGSRLLGEISFPVSSAAKKWSCCRMREGF